MLHITREDFSHNRFYEHCFTTQLRYTELKGATRKEMEGTMAIQYDLYLNSVGRISKQNDLIQPYWLIKFILHSGAGRNDPVLNPEIFAIFIYVSGITMQSASRAPLSH